jgi:hypothetical protein
MSDDVYQPKEKKIFRYNDGEKVVAADPLLLRGKLTLAAIQRGKTIGGVIESANKVDLEGISDIELSEAWAALDMLADISQEAFGLVPFNAETGNGADMAHAIGLVDHFYKWCEKKNQQPDLPQTSTPPSESTSETPPTTATSSVSA